METVPVLFLFCHQTSSSLLTFQTVKLSRIKPPSNFLYPFLHAHPHAAFPSYTFHHLVFQVHTVKMFSSIVFPQVCISNAFLLCALLSSSFTSMQIFTRLHYCGLASLTLVANCFLFQFPDRLHPFCCYERHSETYKEQPPLVSATCVSDR